MSEYPGDQRFADEQTSRDNQRRAAAAKTVEQRLAEWRVDDAAGYDALIGLMGAAEDELARLRALVADWQPIATAPREPRTAAILAGSNGIGEARLVDDYWWWAGYAPDEVGTYGDPQRVVAPTHWQPLPAPPARGEG